MTGSSIHCDNIGPVQIITINRPKVRNALSVGTSVKLSAFIDAFEADTDARVAVLTGEGTDAFCAGGDLKNREEGVSPPITGFGGLTKRFNRTKPLIAAVNGAAFGGGFELALACDLIIAAENAVFCLPELRRGLMPAGGSLYRLPAAVGDKAALGIILTAREVSATEAKDLGLVFKVVPPVDLRATAVALAGQIAALSPLAIRASLDAVRRGQAVASIEQAMNEQSKWPAVEALRHSHDRSEGITAFREKRPPEWRNR